jgi:hypothetical protein
MSFYKTKIILMSSFLVVGLINTPASAAGSKPKLNISCGQITGGVDENGTYGLFKPKIKVSFYGKPLSVIAYFYDSPSTPKSEAGQSIWQLTGSANSSTYFVSNLELERKILTFSIPQTGYYKIVFEAVDSTKRKGTYTCLYKDYYFDVPTTDTNTGYSSRGFNKSSCTFNGKKLYGRVYFTKYSFESDIKVYVTNYSFESDLRVYLTDYSFDASSCGRWYPTDYSFDSDFKVYLTNYSFESDLKIYETKYGFEAGR